VIAYILLLLIGLKIKAGIPFWILWGLGSFWHFLYWAAKGIDK
jgi:hypothetical protein